VNHHAGSSCAVRRRPSCASAASVRSSVTTRRRGCISSLRARRSRSARVLKRGRSRGKCAEPPTRAGAGEPRWLVAHCLCAGESGIRAARIRGGVSW